ncbi:MAG: stage II sporulation protein M [Firmicutes bacterium]|nr:stage II sporulation protein M [Bacillota bacterium]
MLYYFRQRLPLLTGTLILLLMGLIFGSLAVKTLSPSQVADLGSYIYSFYNSFPQELKMANRHSLAVQCIVDNIIKINGLVWVLGLTIIGAPLILGIIFMRGFVLGFTVGFIISEMSFNGIIVAIASVLPHNLLILPALIITSTTSLSFAAAAVKTLTGSSKGNILNQFIGSTLIILVSCALLAAAALVEMYITPIFIQLSHGLIT